MQILAVCCHFQNVVLVHIFVLNFRRHHIRLEIPLTENKSYFSPFFFSCICPGFNTVCVCVCMYWFKSCVLGN